MLFKRIPHKYSSLMTALLLFWIPAALTGCRSAQRYRKSADDTATRLIHQAQEASLGHATPFEVKPDNRLREKLLLSHHLPYSSSESLGSGHLDPIAHWPEDDYLKEVAELAGVTAFLNTGEALHLSLLDALQIGAANSREYQSRKESVYRTALDLDLQEDAFRTTFAGLLTGALSQDKGADPDLSGFEGTGSLGISEQLKNGAGLSTALALDVVKMLTQGRSASRGITFDASISIPLLRGAGRHIVAEPLTQAQRNLIYAIYDFERYKREFAVQVAREYLGVLRQRNQVRNVEENYRGLIASARRARRLADAGRLPEFQFDQAVQDEFRARNRWIQGLLNYDTRLDQFKITLGLPPDARITLDENDLDRLQGLVTELVGEAEITDRYEDVPPADAPVELVPPGQGQGGPMEMDPGQAIQLALAHRLDLRIARGEVYDAQRAVVVAADALRPEITLFGSAQAGQSRSLSSAGSDDARLDFDEGFYSALLSADLGLERTAERNAYRESYLDMEAAVRSLQAKEDEIKLEIRGGLRDLLEFRESIRIQAQAVRLAEKRVRSTNLFLQAGRAEIRDLLDSQEDLLSAQNALNDAIVNYRMTELGLQRDLGMLEIDAQGLWKETFKRDNNNE